MIWLKKDDIMSHYDDIMTHYDDIMTFVDFQAYAKNSFSKFWIEWSNCKNSEIQNVSLYNKMNHQPSLMYVQFAARTHVVGITA